MKPSQTPTVAPQPGSTATRIPARDFLLLHLTLFLYAVVSVLGKYAGVNLAIKETALAILFMGLEFFTLAVYAVLWQQTLKRMPLSFAYSNKGVCTLWSCLFGILFFGENLTLGKAVGILVVLAGVWLVVSDHE